MTKEQILEAICDTYMNGIPGWKGEGGQKIVSAKKLAAFLETLTNPTENNN